jgi:hypothetical protein
MIVFLPVELQRLKFGAIRTVTGGVHAIRRTKAPEEGTRGPQAVSYGDFGIRPVAGMSRRLWGSVGIDADGPLCRLAIRLCGRGAGPDAALSAAAIIVHPHGLVAGC